MEIESQKKPDFPELVCSSHNIPIIFVNAKVENTSKMFLCPKCVKDQFTQMSSTDLMYLDEFINFISKSPNTTRSTSEIEVENTDRLLQEQGQNVGQFQQLIDEEKKKVQQTMSKLQNLYQDKCSELVETLKTEFNQQQQYFSENYQKFESATQSDFEKDANIPKFSEIINNIQKMNDLKDKEEYLANVYKKKQAWDNASSNIQTIGHRTQHFYQEQVINQIQNPPRFANMAQLIQTWIIGLDKLIDQVREEAGVFENFYQKNPPKTFVTLEVKNLDELTLVTNEMLNPDTQFLLNFEGQKISQEDANKIQQALSNLNNIQNLQINLEEASINSNALQQIVSSFKSLPSLNLLDFLAFGSKLGDQGIQELAEGLTSVANQIKYLNLSLGYNNIGNQGVSRLAESIGKMNQLTSLKLDVKNNNVKSSGAVALGENLENIGQNLTHVTIDFGGYSVKHNEIQNQGGIALLRAIKKFNNILDFTLDLSHNKISDEFMSEFSMTFAVGQFQKLRKLSLQLNNNDFQFKGIKKFAKTLAKLHFNSLNLNLNSIQFKNDGANELIMGLRRMQNLENLHLNIRNVGLKKNQISNLKNDLEKQKQGKEFAQLEFLA